jgi:hypothetical protein
MNKMGLEVICHDYEVRDKNEYHHCGKPDAHA